MHHSETVNGVGSRHPVAIHALPHAVIAANGNSSE